MGLIRGAAKLGAAAVVIKMGSDALEKHEDKKAQRQTQPPQQQQQHPQGQQMNFARPRSQSPMPRSTSPGHASYCNGNCGGQCMGQATRAIEQAPAYDTSRSAEEYYANLKA